MEEYFRELNVPAEKVPRVNTRGERYRELQLSIQLPRQDLALAYCKYIEHEHWKLFDEFVNYRNEHALDIGYVRHCNETNLVGTLMSETQTNSKAFVSSSSWHRHATDAQRT